MISNSTSFNRPLVISLFETVINQSIGRFQAIKKTDVLLIFSFISGDKTEFLRQ